MNRLFYFFLLLVVLVSCTENELDGIQPAPGAEMVGVSLEVLSGESKTRIYYDQNKNNQFVPKWNTGDKVAIVTKNRQAGAPFVMNNNGGKTSLEGQIQYWNDTTTMYAVYPYRDDYYGFDGSSFLYKADGQVINVENSDEDSHESNTNALTNAILISKSAAVGFDQSGDLNVGHIYFKQVMSFLRFTLVSPNKLHKLNRVTLKDVENTFVTEAKIKMDESGEIRYDNLKYSNQLTATITSQDESNKAIVNFALLPTTIKNAILEIEAVDENGNEYIFTKELPANLAFTRNNFNYFSKDLYLNSDSGFKAEGVYDLSSFTWHSEIPAGNSWIIKSPSKISNVLMTNLRKKVEDSGREISLKFIDVKELEGHAAFEYWKNLKSLELPICEEIGSNSFRGCHSLTKVVMPALRKAGMNTFFDHGRDPNVEVEFIVATNPGVKLDYAEDGGWVSGGKYGYGSNAVERVHLIMGNQELYDSNQYGDDYFVFPSAPRAIFFGSITWK